MGDRSGNGKKWHLDWMGKDVKTGGADTQRDGCGGMDQQAFPSSSSRTVLPLCFSQAPQSLLTVSFLGPPRPDSLEPMKNLAGGIQ